MINLIKNLNVFNKIKFIDNEHLYLIDGVKSNGSITKVLSMCKKPFDSEKWSKHVANRDNKSQKTVLEEWKINSTFSTQLGTLLHSYIENYWFNKIKKYDQQLIIEKFGEQTHSDMRSILGKFIKSFHGFYKQHNHITPIRSELVIGDIDVSKVCGTVDLLAYNSEINAFEIYDYKTNKKFTTSNQYNEKYINSNISHLDVCDLNNYSLQQSLYRYIIEKYTDIKIANSYLIWFNREDASCEKIKCRDLTEYCEALLKDYSSNFTNNL